MYGLYVFSVWLHLLAVAVWLGGMLFLVLVVVPWLRRGGRASAAVFLQETGKRFRNIGWICFGVLAMTGSFNLWMRGVRLADLVDPQWLSSPFGRLVVLKLVLFAAVLAVSVAHDFVVGPRATAALQRDLGEAEVLRRRASLLGRSNLLLGLLLAAAGVMLVRGWPW